jgi:ATP-dependent RNA helicase RhlE
MRKQVNFSDFALSARLLEAVRDLGYEQPTPIQTQAIPPALLGRDVIGCAQTGTGKTAAFLLPLIERLLDGRPGGTRALVLVPTRELVIQVTEQAKALSRHTRLHVAAIYGGVGMGSQEQALRHQRADIVIATPGRLLDHMQRGHIAFDKLEVLVLDEADRMLDMGFLPDVRRILRRVPQQRQTLLFSATMPPAIQALAREVQRDPALVEVARSRPPTGVSQSLYPVSEHLKTPLLLALFEQQAMTSVLVFTRTKYRADRLAKQLARAGVKVGRIHGDRTQGQRVAALEGFRSGQYRVLVATDIAARGLDVEGISHVVNYDIPAQPDDYIHRIGRTARVEAVGDALTFITPADEFQVRLIERTLGRALERRQLPGFDYQTAAPSHARPSAKDIQRQIAAGRTSAQRWAQVARGLGRR